MRDLKVASSELNQDEGMSVATPFVKWAGGKRSLISEIEKVFPDKVDRYYEPFVGGGAVFFAFADRIEEAILSDSNLYLVLTYKAVKEHLEPLLEALKKHEVAHKQNDQYYNEVRRQKLDEKNIVSIAARFIYLNKTCFNGLYRENRKGEFNVPKGRYENPAICNEKVLKDASYVLQNVDIICDDFEKVVEPRAGDFIYCDPPMTIVFLAITKLDFRITIKSV